MEKQKELMKIVDQLRKERPVEAAFVDRAFKNLTMEEVMLQTQQDLPEILNRKNTDLDVFNFLSKFHSQKERDSLKMQAIKSTLEKEEKQREDDHKKQDELRSAVAKELPDVVAAMRAHDDPDYRDGIAIDDPALTEKDLITKTKDMLKLKDDLVRAHKNSLAIIDKEQHINLLMKEYGISKYQAEAAWSHLNDTVWEERNKGRDRTAEEEPILESHMDAARLYRRSSVGKIIRWNTRDAKKFLPEGWCGLLEEREFKNTGESSLLVRNSTIDVVDLLSKAEYMSFTQKTDYPIIVHGEKSCGKSATLQHAVYWARKSGWLVFNIKSMLKLAHSGGIIEKSKYFSGCWDQPLLAVRILSSLLDVHQDKLKTIRLKTDIQIPKFEGSNLFDLVEFGAALHEVSSTVIWHLVEELKRVYEYPVLIAIDDYNVVYNYNQAYRDPECTHYKPRKLQNKFLTLCMTFKDLHIRNPLVNGNVLLSTSYETTMRHFDLKERINTNKTHVVDVPVLDEYDVNRLLDHWQRTKFVYADTTRETRKILMALSGGRGSELSRFCSSL